MRNAPPKFSKLWTDVPLPSDRIGAYTTEQLEQMNHTCLEGGNRAADHACPYGANPVRRPGSD
jgi:hypothetical protein